MLEFQTSGVVFDGKVNILGAIYRSKKNREKQKKRDRKQEFLRKTSFQPNRFLYACNSKTNHCKNLKFSPYVDGQLRAQYRFMHYTTLIIQIIDFKFNTSIKITHWKPIVLCKGEVYKYLRRTELLVIIANSGIAQKMLKGICLCWYTITCRNNSILYFRGGFRWIEDIDIKIYYLNNPLPIYIELNKKSFKNFKNVHDLQIFIAKKNNYNVLRNRIN
ncbi:hypothetical protein AGLY_010923 [Aphis glycines]|uniref:Uncharacterized protein n=1 Tax=Aphis glycines TaxID=307491 RepID=A0A6G0TE47_APHGL|nr:hypothetical protein AGLY_010923 [Aphis glycines]